MAREKVVFQNQHKVVANAKNMRFLKNILILIFLFLF